MQSVRGESIVGMCRSIKGLAMDAVSVHSLF